jgi:NAD-dependent SIR2 family protein deacetylase
MKCEDCGRVYEKTRILKSGERKAPKLIECQQCGSAVDATPVWAPYGEMSKHMTPLAEQCSASGAAVCGSCGLLGHPKVA